MGVFVENDCNMVKGTLPYQTSNFGLGSIVYGATAGGVVTDNYRDGTLTAGASVSLVNSLPLKILDRLRSFDWR